MTGYSDKDLFTSCWVTFDDFFSLSRLALAWRRQYETHCCENPTNRGFSELIQIQILRVRKFQYPISRLIFYMYFECNYQIHVTKICDEGRITDFIPNISALNSSHFTYYQLNNRLPSAGQTMSLHHFRLLLTFFQP